MIIEIPGWKTLDIRTAVFDYNGTIARDGRIDDTLRVKLGKLADVMPVRVLTADTFNNVNIMLEGFEGQIEIIPREKQAESKRDFVLKLGREHVVAFGNGANDQLMLETAALGICIAGPEGAALETVMAADILIPDIGNAIDLLFNPDRLRASLRR
ncbi:HAD hydrolase family protein [bacterium]|nr:HAD hydrolase family protein [candidate division CSSED10-310 bacterium]